MLLLTYLYANLDTTHLKKDLLSTVHIWTKLLLKMNPRIWSLQWTTFIMFGRWWPSVLYVCGYLTFAIWRRSQHNLLYTIQCSEYTITNLLGWFPKIATSAFLLRPFLQNYQRQDTKLLSTLIGKSLLFQVWKRNKF